MRARNGQVAVYLVLVLVAIAVLMVMNVNAFLAVRSKNRMMNAVDGAALAAAKWQGTLLNRLGEMNVRHLRSLIYPNDVDPWTDENELAMRDLAMFGPLQGLEEAQLAATQWGFANSECSSLAKKGLRQHVGEIGNEYVANPDLYPEYRERQWSDYAARLSAHLDGGLSVIPGYMETANGWRQDPLLNEAFYDAIAAKAWCWFSIGNRSRYFDMDSKTMPRPEFQDAHVQENSEIYGLHVTFRTWMDSAWANEYVPGVGFSERWTNFVCQVTGCTRAELAAAPQVANEERVWAFYDDSWGAWSRTFNPGNIPIAGNVKPEYDVAGCAASSILIGEVARIADDEQPDDVRQMLVSAEAKPFGTVTVDGAVEPVTAFCSFIAPSEPGGKIFTEAQLVLMGSVPTYPGVSLNPQWYEHVKEHLPRYFAVGPDGGGGCYYCRQLVQWENPAFRAAARDWLTAHGTSCQVHGGDGGRGGYDWAH